MRGWNRLGAPPTEACRRLVLVAHVVHGVLGSRLLLLGRGALALAGDAARQLGPAPAPLIEHGARVQDEHVARVQRLALEGHLGYARELAPIVREVKT